MATKRKVLTLDQRVETIKLLDSGNLRTKLLRILEWARHKFKIYENVKRKYCNEQTNIFGTALMGILEATRQLYLNSSHPPEFELSRRTLYNCHP